ncbi:helix-turn-helix domain-containing protein [uncultured Chryseobacterium sp.]|uniref:helix-turn-helix domain-containing protein n=1 Tax=uncultured Chryseobacterium sp. TaxID=259322 RepID=UPI00374884BB
MNAKPDYKKICMDMIAMKYPEKACECQTIFIKKVINIMDVIKLDRIISGVQNRTDSHFNQKLKSYDPKTFLEILEYQKKNGLNNSQLAQHFKLSRNTVTKWKKMFLYS